MSEVYIEVGGHGVRGGCTCREEVGRLFAEERFSLERCRLSLSTFFRLSNK